jgi:hypothetical protein
MMRDLAFFFVGWIVGVEVYRWNVRRTYRKYLDSMEARMHTGCSHGSNSDDCPDCRH